MGIFNRVEEMLSGGYHETRVADYFLIPNTKWHIASFIAFYLIFAWKLGPMLMKNRSPLGLRPWMLILDGLQFGIYGLAIPIIGWLSDSGAKAWQCNKPEHGDFIEEVLLRLSYTYLWLKIADITTTLIMILRKKPNQEPLFHALRNSSLILVVYFGMRMYAQGSFLFLPFTDAILTVFRAAYYVLAAPGTAFRQHLWFKRYIHWIALLLGVFNMLHMSHHLVKSCAGPPGIMLLILAHSLGEIFYAVKTLSDKTSLKISEMASEERVAMNGKKAM